MIKVGLTGGIGSGKSMAATIFKLLGVPVFNADYEAKKAMSENAGLQQAIISEFGSNAYVDGKLNRVYLAGQVFNDGDKLKKLNALVHPVTIEAAESWAKAQEAPYTIKEAALLFEAGSARQLDYIIGVCSPPALRIQRVMKRDQLTAEQVKERMQNQLDDSLKMRLCDFVLHNNEEELLIPQVVSIHEKLLNLSAGHLTGR